MSSNLNKYRMLSVVAIAWFGGHAHAATSTVGVGFQPLSIAVNSQTNKIYVPTSGNTVVVIDGSDNSTTTLNVADYLQSKVAVNPVTNKIYMSVNSNVTVIDGSNNSKATVMTGGGHLIAIAVNTATNKVYVADYTTLGGGDVPGSTVTVIDGTNNSIASVNVGPNPSSIAVNTATNLAYVVNSYNGTMTVIDGANKPTTVNVCKNPGDGPYGIAINQVTNKIYVTNLSGSYVTVIDGNNNTTFVNVGSGPLSVAVNSMTNKIYVANSTSNDVTVIDGVTNNTTTVKAGTDPESLVVNPGTNQIYVANAGSNDVTVINGSNNTTTTVAVGNKPIAIALNSKTNKVYVANGGSSNNVTVIDGGAALPSKVGVFRYGYYWVLDVNGNNMFDSANPGPDAAFAFGGISGDIPIAGDWNGDGRTKVGVFRGRDGTFLLDYDGDKFFTAADKYYDLGVGKQPGDIPVVGDWNGDGRTKVGIFRNGYFWILDVNGNGVFDAGVDKAFAFGGVAGDVPVVGDWNGDGKSKVGLFRAGYFWILDVNNNGTIDNVNVAGGDAAFAFGGISGDVPVVGDWNGDGRSKVGVFRQGFFWVLDANGNTSFDGTGAGQDLAFAFGGISGDKPVIGKWAY